jgi:hypothetical protein
MANERDEGEKSGERRASREERVTKACIKRGAISPPLLQAGSCRCIERT